MKIIIDDIINTQLEEFDGDEVGYDHKLLCYFGRQYNNEMLAEIGTRHGLGALALAQNLSNHIITYDVTDEFWRSKFAAKRKNIEFRIRDIIYYSGTQEVLHCPFIYLDVDPHTGYLEEIFIRDLENNNYMGIVLLDDITNMFPQLFNWYNNLQTVATKYYLPDYNHLLYRWAILDFTHELEIV